MRVFKFCFSVALLLAFFPLRGQEVVSTSFTAPSLGGESIPLSVYLPQGYDESGAPYNLYVFLHGCCGSTPQSHLTLFQTRLDQLIASGRIAPLVVVFPSVQGADFGNRHMWYNSERNGAYGDLVSVDLLDWVQANYNISDIKRAVGGFSMGADGALRMGLNDSEKFVAAVGHAAFPALDFFPNLIPALISETGQSAPPYTFTPSPGTLTEIIYGAASAWSPNNDNPDYNLDFILDENGMLIDSVFARWKINADIDSIIRFNWGESKEVPTSLYIDIGTSDGFYPPNALLQTELTTLVQAEDYQINYKYLEFSGGHVLTGAKIDSSLVWLHGVFSNILSANSELAHTRLDLFIYPNPTQHSITLSFQNPSQHNYLLEFVNMSGQVIEQRLLNSFPPGENRLQIDVSQYPRGTYQIRITNERGQIVTKKLVKL